ncbi:hypothetical protein ACX80I_12640 [Arthrobacter sp. MDT3-44]
MLYTIPDNRTSGKARPETTYKSMLPAHYAQAASWLTFNEWKRLTERARRRATAPVILPAENFTDALDAADLSGPVKFTLTVMHDLANREGHLQVSKAHLANLLGTTTRTIQRHWAIAEAHGFLVKHDYPMDQKRPSDMWLRPGTAPKRDTYWDQFPETPMQDAETPPPW